MKAYRLWPFLLISSCMVGPNYQTPEVAIPDTWSAENNVDNSAPLVKWWTVFNDELLIKYIELAKEHNYSLQAAEANILKARALRQVAASKLFPHVNADVNGFKTYFSKQGPIFAIGPVTGDTEDTINPADALPFTIQVPQIQNLFNALLDVSWELDLFGKTRRSVESAVAELESLIEKRNGILISTYAEIARNYIELRSFQMRAILLEKNIDLFEKEAQIMQANVQTGYRNQLDLEQTLAKLAEAKAAYPETQSEIYRAIFTISILIGASPETLVEELLPAKDLPTIPKKIAIGLRSDLLLRRPDVRYAERKLAEATADIGVAVASFFPTISLLATGGFQSLLLPKLFEWGSRTWAYGADVNMPMFQGGQLTGNLKLSKAAQAEAAANYQQIILTAIQEAESGLKKYEEQLQSIQLHQENVEHKKRVTAITQERHLKGLINCIDLLNSKKELIESQLKEIDSQTQGFLSVITLYKALGGGWECEEK